MVNKSGEISSNVIEEVEKIIKEQYDLRLEVLDLEETKESEELQDKLLEIKIKALNLIEQKDHLRLGYTLGLGKKYMQVRQSYLELVQKHDPANLKQYVQETEITANSATLLANYRQKIVELHELERVVKASTELQNIESETNDKIASLLKSKNLNYEQPEVFEKQIKEISKQRKSSQGLAPLFSLLICFALALLVGVKIVLDYEGIVF